MNQQFLRAFVASEDGAVTVDWVVLTAAVVGLAALAIVGIQSSTGAVGSNVGDYLSAREVGAGSD
jgi:Flp pilus assembly pilin Flp